MGPSTATPTNLHRAPVACLKCRAAKVRCLVSHRTGRCDRCIANDTECLFAHPKRTNTKVKPTPKRKRAVHRVQRRRDRHSCDNDETMTIQTPSWSSLLASEESFAFQATDAGHNLGERGDGQKNTPCPVTGEVRARIIATLATLRGKRGAPFSFVTSGERQPFSSKIAGQEQNLDQQCQQSNPNSLKLSWLLRPLRRAQASHESYSRTWVPMPSYTSSLNIGQTVVDPIIGGILSGPASEAMFLYFMAQMNARWEYILDPLTDTHDDVRRRSCLLFSTVLFCASKFGSYQDGKINSIPDSFLQTRLCSVARNLAIRTMAEGDRSIETMQAFYLLVCWKDPDDDISYLHSGYAFRILNDLELEPGSDRDSPHNRRRRRTWLALYRQNKQQSLFFMRRSFPSLGEEDSSALLEDLSTWIQSPHVTPLDFVALCSVDIRRIQSKLRNMVHKASSEMLPCVLDLMSSELVRWTSTWNSFLDARHDMNDSVTQQTLLHPGRGHFGKLMGLWQHGARLHVSSAILRQALMASVTSSILSNTEQNHVDLPDISEVLPPEVPGLSDGVEGALGTLRHLLEFPKEHLRNAPDVVVLLAPNAALFLCLLLCLPCNGILGPGFQTTAIVLIEDVARHIREAVVSPQDTLALHSVYLDSLANLLSAPTPHNNASETGRLPSTVLLHANNADDGLDPQLDEPALVAAHVLAGGMNSFNSSIDEEDIFDLTGDLEQHMHMQGLANLLDMSSFWEMPPTTLDLAES